MVICTGSQAERNAVLARAARGEHPQLQLGRTDTVVFASRPVPGNEPDVEAMIAALIAQGVKVVTHDGRAHPRVRPRLARTRSRR